MESKDRGKLIEENDERLLGGYGAHLRASNAAPADRLSQQIRLAALAELQQAPGARRKDLVWLLGARRGFALAGALAVLAITLTTYILLGGRPNTPAVVANASASGAQISARHSGLFGLNWYLPLGFDSANTAALALGDEIKTDATTHVTLTFQTGTQVLIKPNSVVQIESIAPLRVMLWHGEILNLVQPSDVAGQPALQVLSGRGEYTARGTVYDVQVAGAGDRVKTREGEVGARTAKAEQIVAKGQEANISDSGLITRQLSAPEVMLELPSAPLVRDGDSIATNARNATITVSTAAGARVDATLETTDHKLIVLPSALANAQGEATLSLSLPTRDIVATLSITTTDTSADKLGTTAARPITITVDHTPPLRFTLNELTSQPVAASPVSIVGTTESNTTMTVNGAAIMVAEDGSFSAEVPLVQGNNRVVFVIADSAGNTLRIVQTYVLR